MTERLRKFASPPTSRILTRMNLRPLFPSLVAAACLTGSSASAAAATDPSIDRLLRKLPAPEELAPHRSLRGQSHPSDPILTDSLAQEASNAFRQKNYRRALAASRKLIKRYPNNPTAHAFHGIVALTLQQSVEAGTAFGAALTLRPDFSVARLGMGASEAAQGRLVPALRQFREFTRLEPQADIGWMACSGCALRLGKREESLTYAKRAVTVSPRSSAAWLQMAKDELALGHNAEARRASARARQLGATPEEVKLRRG